MNITTITTMCTINSREIVQCPDDSYAVHCPFSMGSVLLVWDKGVLINLMYVELCHNVHTGCVSGMYCLKRNLSAVFILTDFNII